MAVKCNTEIVVWQILCIVLYISNEEGVSSFRIILKSLKMPYRMTSAV
jgi:hypothetical protein